MTNTKTANKKSATPDITPAMLAHLELLTRQRKNAARALLKRRRRKSGQ
jgi:hypothetical protein